MSGDHIVNIDQGGNSSREESVIQGEVVNNPVKRKFSYNVWSDNHEYSHRPPSFYKKLDDRFRKLEDLCMEEYFPGEPTKTQFSFWILIPFILKICALITTLTVPLFKNKNVCHINLWKWQVMVFVLTWGGLVSDWFVRITLFGIEKMFLLRKRYVSFVYGVKKSVQNFMWLGLVLIAWNFLFDKRDQREMSIDFHLKILFLVATLLWLSTTLLVNVIATNLHLSAYFDRIQDLQFSQVLIEKLSRQPLEEVMEIPDLTQIRCENEAETVATKICHNVARRGGVFIQTEDLLSFMRQDEVVRFFNLFEGASDSGKISTSAFKSWVLNAFRERRALILSLSDTKSAVNNTHLILKVFVVIIIWIVSFFRLDTYTKEGVVFVILVILLVGIMTGFGQIFVESIIFFLVKHPFDVDDRCKINGTDMIVEDMQMWRTLFSRISGNGRIVISNQFLATNTIHNIDRIGRNGRKKYKSHSMKL